MKEGKREEHLQSKKELADIAENTRVIDSIVLSKEETNHYKIDSKSNFKIVLTVAWIYCEQLNYDSAMEVLKDAIDHVNKNTSLNMLYFMELLEISGSIRDYNNFKLFLNTF